MLVKTDDNGEYETNLPFGVWTMTLQVGPNDTSELAHPRHFQIVAAGSLVFNIHLRPPIACTILSKTAESAHEYCWGEKFFQVPSATGVPFEVDLFNLHPDWTTCGAFEAQAKSPHREFATYNVVTLEADKVTYDPSGKILEGSGDVVMQDENGEHKADSVKLFLLDGQAYPVQ